MVFTDRLANNDRIAIQFPSFHPPVNSVNPRHDPFCPLDEGSEHLVGSWTSLITGVTRC
jgi:hypothetical protein